MLEVYSLIMELERAIGNFYRASSKSPHNASEAG